MTNLHAKIYARQRFLADYNMTIGAARKEGLVAGKAEGKIDITRNMKQKGCNFEAIVDLTGLSYTEVEQLK